MKKQNYSNHIKYYPPHHFIFLPMMTGLMIWGLWNAFDKTSNKIVYLLFSILCFCILYLAIMLRQHYALGNQDRIVRLEFRLRYFEIFGKSSQQIENRLTFKQIAALRFADDNEFVQLLKQVEEGEITSDEIKKAISNWQPDNMRL